MKKLYFIMIFCTIFLYSDKLYAQNQSLCEVTNARFSLGGLNTLNSKGENVFELQGQEQTVPQMEILISTKNCKDIPPITMGIFAHSKGKLKSVATYSVKVEKDGDISIPVGIGTPQCLDKGNSNYLTCRYILGFQDQLTGDPAKSGILIPDVNNSDNDGRNFHFVGLHRNANVDIYDYAGKAGLTFMCSNTTCERHGFEIGGSKTASSLMLDGVKSINNGFTSDPCNETKDDNCYTLLSDIPIPEKTDGQFSIAHKEVQVQGGGGTIKKTVITGMFPYLFAVDSFITWFVYFVILLAVVRLIYIGYRQITTESAGAKTENRQAFLNVFMGMGICFTFFVILNTINPDLLGDGPSIKKQTLEALGDIPSIASYSQTVQKTSSGGGGGSSPTPIDIKVFTLPNNGVWFEADMDIDMDGDYKNYSADEKALVAKYDRRTNQPQTSWKFPSGGNYPNAFRFPYYVLPSGWGQKYGLKLGDIGAIVRGDTVIYAVYADNGPYNKIGEGSAFLAKQIDPGHTNFNAAVPYGVSYILFPNSAISDLSSNNWQSKLNEKGSKLFNQVKNAYANKSQTKK